MGEITSDLLTNLECLYHSPLRQAERDSLSHKQSPYQTSRERLTLSHTICVPQSSDTNPLCTPSESCVQGTAADMAWIQRAAITQMYDIRVLYPRHICYQEGCFHTHVSQRAAITQMYHRIQGISAIKRAGITLRYHRGLLSHRCIIVSKAYLLSRGLVAY